MNTTAILAAILQARSQSGINYLINFLCVDLWVTVSVHHLFNNEHEVTKVFGVPSLDAEKSLNLSGGLTSTISRHIYLTIDAYWIQIRNRIVLSGAFDRVTNPEVDSLLKSSSIDGYPDVGQVSFFSNAIN